MVLNLRKSKKGDDEEVAPMTKSSTSSSSSNDGENLKDKGNVIKKLTEVLEKMNLKFGDKYKGVKMTVAFPALVQLIAQAQAQKSSKEEWQRDIMFKTGKSPTSDELTGLDRDMYFADWAYLDSTDEIKENLTNYGFTLLKHEKPKSAGFVGYYIAIDEINKIALIGVKGTSSLEDVLTDCCAQTVTHELEGSFMDEGFSLKGLLGGDKSSVLSMLGMKKQGFKEIHCHEGILISAKRLADDLKPFVRSLFLPLGYKIRVCGHSLGAGASSLVAILLRSQIPELIKSDSIEVKAFASPPVLDYAASLATTSFITTIVNNSDIIPRTSLNNFEIMIAVLAVVQKKLEENGCNASDIGSTYAFLKKLGDGTGGDMIMTTDESFQVLEQCQKEVSEDDPDHLYVAGKVIVMYGKWQDAKRLEEERKELKEKEKSEKKKEKSGKKDLDLKKIRSSVAALSVDQLKLTGDKKDDGDNADYDDEMEKLPSYCFVDNGVTKCLRAIEIDDAMVSNHSTDSYHARIKAIMKN